VGRSEQYRRLKASLDQFVEIHAEEKPENLRKHVYWLLERLDEGDDSTVTEEEVAHFCHRAGITEDMYQQLPKKFSWYGIRKHLQRIEDKLTTEPLTNGVEGHRYNLLHYLKFIFENCQELKESRKDFMEEFATAHNTKDLSPFAFFIKTCLISGFKSTKHIK